jgi:hypothetical protein
MSSGVAPLGKVVYVCDDVLQDPVSGKLHVLGAFTSVRPPDGVTYPFRLRRLCVFAQLTGGLGRSAIEAKVVDATTGNEVFGSPTHQVTFPGGTAVVTVLFRLLRCPFPRPGTYLVQLFCQGTFIDDRRLTAH